MSDDRDFFASATTQAREPVRSRRLDPMPVPAAITLALMLTLGAIGIVITILKIGGLF